MRSTRPGRNAARAFARILQHALLLHSGSFRQTSRGRRAPGRNHVFALHGRPRSNGIHSRREGQLHRARRALRKNFRTGQTRQRFDLERPIQLLRTVGCEGAARGRNRGGGRTGTSRLPHGQSRFGTTHLSLLRAIRETTDERKPHRSHSSAERHGADSGSACALHLRISQRGALAEMVARNVPSFSRTHPAAIAEHETRLVHRHP